MRKLFSILITFLLFANFSFASADIIDFSAVSDDELLLLQNQLEAEIASRGLDTNSLIFEGVYVVGKDIRAGQYILTVVDCEYGMSVITFASEDTYGSYFSTKRFTVGEENSAIEANASSSTYVEKTETLSLNLHDGMVLLLKNGTGRLDAVTPSWAP